MARSRRKSASRTVFIFVGLAVVLGATFQFHRLHKANATVAKAEVAPAAPIAPPLMAIAPKPAPVMDLTLPSTRPALRLTPEIWDDKPATATPPAPTPVVAAPPAPAPVSAPSAAVSKPVAQVGVPSKVLDDARTKADAGDLVSARKALNDSLLSGSLSESDADAVKKQISQINQTLVFSPQHFADDPFGGIYTVKPGQRLSKIADACEVTWKLLLRLNKMTDARKLHAGQTIKLVKGPFHLVINKSKFNMDVYLGSPGAAGSMYITSYPVGLGKDDSTPTGTWMIKDKVSNPTYYSPRGEGVIQSQDPKNPLGPYWIGLSGTDGHAVGKASYGIHGTIEPDSIGKMASLGCIRMHNEDVAIIYELMVEGKSTVIVRD